MLVGRERELARLDALLADARRGTSGVIVLRGEPGIGKSALLAAVAARAEGMTVLAARGVESEVQVPFAGLQELLRPALTLLGRVPGPQAAALRGALGLESAAAGDRALIGAATLSLLGAQAEEAPTLVLVDDLQWMDGASAAAVVFAARRLLADAVAVVFAARAGEPSAADGAGLPEYDLAGLDADASRSLIEHAAGGAVSPTAAERLLAACAGNPLGLAELAGEAAELPPAPTEGPLPVGARIQRAFGRRLAGLSPAARAALLVAAAGGAAEPAALLRAAEALGGSLAGLEEAEAAGLVEIRADGRVAFRHPLIRSVAYAAAPAGRRRAAHRALAAVLADPDRQAWHAAAGTVAADERVATALAAVAARARERSAYAAAASAFERAARLSPGTSQRAARLLAAADAAWLAGSARHALALVEGEHGADAEHLRGRVLARCGPVPDAVAALRRGADAAVGEDAARAAEMLAEAAYAAAYVGDTATMSACAERAHALAPADAAWARCLASIAHGAALVFAGEGGRAAEHLRAAAAIVAADPALRDDPRVAPWLGIAPLYLRDSDAEYGPLREAVGRARTRGAAGVLPFALFHLGCEAFAAGAWPEGAAAFSEAAQLARETGARVDLGSALAGLARLEARRGAAEAHAHAAEARDLMQALGVPLLESWAHGALADLAWGEGDLAAAIAGLERKADVLAAGGLNDVDMSPAPELVEGYLRVGREADARAAAAEHAAAAAAKGRPWALARAARAQALVGGGEPAFRTALELHAAAPDPFELARTRLAFGEWLRREGQRAAARPELRAAHEGFERLGAAPWVEQARTELRATGETARRREPATLDDLTPQELRVALLLAEGATTREAAAALFLSPKTIEYHLRNAYRKLGVNSRPALADALTAARR